MCAVKVGCTRERAGLRVGGVGLGVRVTGQGLGFTIQGWVCA